jgi:hypothetical protein
MLCKIRGFHVCDNEDCRILGYKNPVRTSQETHYFSAIGSSQLMLCKIRGFHVYDYEECRLLRCHRMGLIRAHVSEESFTYIFRMETNVARVFILH